MKRIAGVLGMWMGAMSTLRLSSILAILVGLSGCPSESKPDTSDEPDADADADADTDTDADADADADADSDADADPCRTEVTETSPASGTMDAYYLDPIVFWLSRPDTKTTPFVVLEGPQGGVAGTTMLDDSEREVTFQPSAPLAPDTAYTATLTYCAGVASIDFTTSELGGPVMTDLVGSTYVVEVSSLDVTVPEGVGKLFTEYAEDDLLLGVTAVDAGRIDFIGAFSPLGGPPAQNACLPVLPFEGATWTDPSFVLGPTDIAYVSTRDSTTVFGVVMSGTFAPDGSYIGGGHATGSIDMREIYLLFPDQFDSADEICELMAGFGASCIPCGDGQVYCMPIEIEDVVARRVDGLIIDPGIVPDPRQCQGASPCSCAAPQAGGTGLIGLLLAGLAAMRRRFGHLRPGTLLIAHPPPRQ